MKRIAGYGLGVFFMWLAYAVGVEIGREAEQRRRTVGQTMSWRSVLDYSHGQRAHPSTINKAARN